MPLIPEKLASRQDVKSAIACQFWEQPSHSTRSIDGQAWSLPCEPPALNLTGSSGLSRTQQLVAAQALGVPAFPSYDAHSEGLVGGGRASGGCAQGGGGPSSRWGQRLWHVPRLCAGGKDPLAPRQEARAFTCGARPSCLA